MSGRGLRILGAEGAQAKASSTAPRSSSKRFRKSATAGRSAWQCLFPNFPDVLFVKYLHTDPIFRLSSQRNTACTPKPLMVFGVRGIAPDEATTCKDSDLHGEGHCGLLGHGTGGGSLLPRRQERTGMTGSLHGNGRDVPSFLHVHVREVTDLSCARHPVGGGPAGH